MPLCSQPLLSLPAPNNQLIDHIYEVLDIWKPCSNFFNCPYTYHLRSIIYILLYCLTHTYPYIHLTFNSYNPGANNYETPAIPKCWGKFSNRPIDVVFQE